MSGFRSLSRIWDVVEMEYDQLSPGTHLLMEGYADGLNVYAAHHPEEVLPGLFPVNGKEIVAASVEKSPLFFDLDKTVGHLFSENPESVLTPTPTIPNNSNEFAIGPGRTSDGKTYLDVNSHQPYTGPVAWYEAHVHSEEGWEMVGGTFPASPLIIHGHNRDLGWAFTVNHPDLVDVYRLTINPENPNQYLFDGAWRDLEVRDAILQIKLIENLQITVKREALWSVYGPAVRTNCQTYVLRYGDIGTAGIWEQLYRMNKPTNFKEWQDAMHLRQLPMFNAAYADMEGNIYYLYNGVIPIRDPELEVVFRNHDIRYSRFETRLVAQISNHRISNNAGSRRQSFKLAHIGIGAFIDISNACFFDQNISQGSLPKFRTSRQGCRTSTLSYRSTIKPGMPSDSPCSKRYAFVRLSTFNL